MQRTLGCHPRVCKSTARAPHAVLPTPALPRFSLLPAEPQASPGVFEITSGGGSRPSEDEPGPRGSGRLRSEPAGRQV